MNKRFCSIAMLLSISLHVLAAGNVEVQALFPGKALLLIDGEAKVLSAGQSYSGIKMISADSREAVLEINGEQKSYTPGGSISMEFVKPSKVSEQIAPDRSGMFFTYGSINGHTTRLLVDTGATFIAISSQDAKNLGIKIDQSAKQIEVSTASGMTRGYLVKLNSVKLGKLEQKFVDAVIVEGRYPQVVLLGMTFLDRLKVTKEAGLMVLEMNVSGAGQ